VEANFQSHKESIDDVSRFNELMDISYDLAKKLLPFLARRRIPLIPENYRLFYDYFLATNPELNRQLNEALQYESLFTPSVSRRLYSAFYDMDEAKAAAITKMGERIGFISQTLEKNLDYSLHATGHFHQVLSESADQMQRGEMEATEIRELVDSLLCETKTALDNQSDLAEKIEDSNKVIAALTAELADQTRLANIDELTQLYNRRWLSQRFTTALAELAPNDYLSVALFDLDRFKNINDTWGHAIGDRVLILCAKILKSFAGDNYSACRFGGEEFLLLCPGADLTAVLKLADKIRKKIQETQITIRGENVPVTISCGVSVYRPGDEASDLLGRADRALYEAKNAGRNRVLASKE
jgi:diguanylate cyclase